MRVPLVCPGCSAKILVRLGLGPTEGTNFYVPCPMCGIPIDGRITGTSLETSSIDFRGAIKFDPSETPDVTITIDPNLPMKFDSMDLSEFGGGPSLTFASMMGDSVFSVAERLSDYKQARHELWDKISHLQEYYFGSQWVHFDRVAAEFFDGYPSSPSLSRRDSAAFNSVLPLLVPLETSSNSAERILTEFNEKMDSFRSEIPFVKYCVEVFNSGAVVRDQRRIWDCIKAYISLTDEWFPGAIADAALTVNEVDISELRLCRDDFSRLRDLYVSCFEACCKAVVHVIAMMNTASRGDPNSMRLDIPSALNAIGVKKLPATTLAQFKKLSNSTKIDYLDEWNIFGTEMKRLLDSKVRNAIGHNSVRHNLRTGCVENDSGESLNYVEFVRLVYCLGAALLKTVHILHVVRFNASIGMDIVGADKLTEMLDKMD